MKPLLTFLDIVRKKRDGQVLTKKEIVYLMSEYTKGNIPDYQMTAFLMAVFFQGMNYDETAYFMQAMMHSGEILDLSDIAGVKLDKHSTGGVGDKISLVLAPLIASCGACVPMISGRGLGHTGGTLDKLEAIPGFRTDLSGKEFKRQLDKIGVAMSGQTAEIAPADKQMYALRDVTATVDSIPLIAASIMSKKLAEDLDGLVLDVKFGRGAFMREYKDAKQLAQAMVKIGKHSKVKTSAVLTNMADPLGAAVGNALEVVEAIEALKGNGLQDVMKVTFALGSEMLRMAKIRGGVRLLKRKISNGQALEKFRQVIENQGGDARVVENYRLLPRARKSMKLIAQKTGYVHGIDTYAIGMSLVVLGGGRSKKEDKIDPACGFKIFKKSGDRVRRGEPLAEIFGHNVHQMHIACANMQDLYTVKRDSFKPRTLIRETVN